MGCWFSRCFRKMANKGVDSEDEEAGEEVGRRGQSVGQACQLRNDLAPVDELVANRTSIENQNVAVDTLAAVMAAGQVEDEEAWQMEEIALPQKSEISRMI